MNSKALLLLNQEEVELAFQVLLKCQDFYKRKRYPFDNALAVLTLNHLSCCYKKIGHPKTALRILDEATEIIFKQKLLDYRGLTYLNKSALLSSLGMLIIIERGP